MTSANDSGSDAAQNDASTSDAPATSAETTPTEPTSPETTTPESGSPEASSSSPASETTPAEPVEAEGASAGEESSTDTPESEASAGGGTEAAATDASEATGGEAGAEQSAEAAVEGEGQAKKRKRRRRKKKKKPGEETHASERSPFHVGEEVFGKVTGVLEQAIMIDLSGKALAIFDRGEMEADDLVPEVGDRFVGSVQNDGGRGGLVVLTRKPLREEESKPIVEQAAKDGTLVEGLVTGVIKGGVDVVINGLRAFAPASGVDLHPQNANLQQLVGERLEFKVTQYDKGGRDVVVTRRPMLEKEAHERRKKALEVLQEGSEMDGVVRTVVEWGAFVALPEAENLEGLVHVSEVSHDPREKISDILKAGTKLRVKILKIDEKGKIWLSRKALIEDPWASVVEKVKPGEVIEGTVTRVEPFGAFVKIGDGIEGLCHVSDLSFERIDDPKKIVSEGDTLQVVVHHVDSRSRRITLHPTLTGERANEARQKVGRNAKLKVEVLKADSPGLNVRILGCTGRQARGFIPAGQTGTQRGTDLRKHFPPGTQLDTKVIDFDPRRGEAKLSISRLAQDEERKAHKEYREKLKAEANFGTLGDLLKEKLAK